jgi:hypothetical protein
VAGAGAGAVHMAARAVSIIGHPAAVMTLAAGVAAAGGDAAPRTVMGIVLATAAVALVVVAFTVVRTRSGRWAHVDASARHERAEFNVFAGALMLTLAVAGHLVHAPPALVVAFALAGLLVVGGHLLRHRLKASLHVGFALFAAGIAWPHVPATAALLAVAGLVAWSRLQLRRHTRADVVAGALLGAACGLLYHVLPPLVR